ncbi:UNVERIFIED_CONTAM: hypothetical protein H355_011645 [Colinus virginianus]|nr:hypothetical protein H355_011645 [Colinus virginianus]
MTHLLARKGGMGPDGVYRDPAAYIPKFSFVVTEPAIRAIHVLLVSLCSFCFLCASSSAVLESLAPATSVLWSNAFEKTRVFLPWWISSQGKIPHAVKYGLGVLCGTLLLYAWYSVIRFVAQGYCLPAKLRSSGSPPSWMKGKVAVVTGGNAGIGLETTKQLARWGTNVFIGCRRVAEASKFAKQFLAVSSTKTDQSATASTDTTERTAARTLDTSAFKAPASETGAIRVHYLDLVDLESVQAFAKWVLTETGGKVDFLINNAGIISTDRVTVDSRTGLEKQFVTNHLGPFLLTQLLLPAVKQANGRIINVSSLAHITRGPKLRALDYAVSQDTASAIASKLKCPLSHLQGEPVSVRNYGSRRVYGDTKMFNIWFTKALQRRLAADKKSTATAYALHPGIVDTDLMVHYGQGTTSWLSHFVAVAHRMYAPLIFKTPERGAATQLMLCVTDQQQLKPGAFYKDGANSWVDPMALDENKQEELWDVSMLMCQPYLSERPSSSVPFEGQKSKATGRDA